MTVRTGHQQQLSQEMTTERNSAHRNQVAEIVGLAPSLDDFGEPVNLPFLRPVARGMKCGIEYVHSDRQSAVFLFRTCDVLSICDPDETLSAEEIRRADTISHMGRRTNFVAGRRMLRQILSEATENALRPNQWRFEIGPNGKPEIARGFPPIFFNLSHSRGYVAIIVNRERAVGVDLERVGNSKSTPVTDVLHPDERLMLAGLAQDQKNRAFTAIWTAKEACSKALGLGINIEFSKLKVDLDRQAITFPSEYGCRINSLRLTLQSICLIDGSEFSLATVDINASDPRIHYLL